MKLIMSDSGAKNVLLIPDSTLQLNTLKAPENSEKGWEKKIEFLFLPNSIKEINPSVLKKLPNLKAIIIPDGKFDRFGQLLPEDWWRMYYPDGCRACRISDVPEGQLYVYGYGTREIINGPQGSTEYHVMIPPTCVSIRREAFMGNKTIASVIMTDSIQFVGERAFFGCSNLRSIHWSKNAKKLSKDLFRGCISIQEIDIPEGVTSIKEGAFRDCASLRTITLPSTIVSIDNGGFFGSNPFRSCSDLDKIIVPKDSIYKFKRLMNGFRGDPAKCLVEAEQGAQEVSESKEEISVPSEISLAIEHRTEQRTQELGVSTNRCKTGGIPMDDIRKAAAMEYSKKWQEDIAVAVWKIAEVIQERLPEADVSYMVHPSEYDSNASEYAGPIHFLFKKNGVPKVAVVAVTENGSRTFSVMETKAWCENNRIKYLRVFATGTFADWITGWSKFSNAPVTPETVEFCKNWLVEKISKHL